MAWVRRSGPGSEGAAMFLNLQRLPRGDIIVVFAAVAHEDQYCAGRRCRGKKIILAERDPAPYK
jgi:hypothetical protein